MAHVCTKCNKDFETSYRLGRHKNRKTPCDAITEKKETCPRCGNQFTTRQSLNRHIRLHCSQPEQPEQPLLKHLAEQKKKTEELEAQIIELSTLLKQQQITTPVTSVQNNVIVITPWDSSRCIDIDVHHVAAAFTGNKKLKQYAGFSDLEQADPIIAPPYVAELLVDLTKRAHEDPSARNIRPSSITDQVLVLKCNGSWELMNIELATRELFNGIAKGILAISRTYDECKLLPEGAQNALAMAGILYDDGPEEYAKIAKEPMIAHLKTCRA